MLTQVEPDTFTTHLTSLANRLDMAGGTSTAEKIRALSTQLASGTVQATAAFCGLFSAGKSSLLNALLEEERLATGAVPTTALVQDVVFPAAPGLILLDTPGIDSTDEAHQQATQDSLHRADVIVLVMDYQHVESEANLELASLFSEAGRRLWLVVHQIDKHVEFELPFAAYQARLERTLADWGIVYEGLWYTSRRQSVHNQLADFRQQLLSLAAASDMRQANSPVEQRVADLVRSYVDDVFAVQRSATDDAVRVRLGVVPFDVAEATLLLRERDAMLDAVQTVLSTATGMMEREQSSRREELVRGIELAQIAPYETTERGREYVESLRPEFRVGWWGAARKTEAERSRRLSVFVSDLADRTQKYLVWPLQSGLRQLVGQVEWAQPAWLADVDTLTLQVTPELCQQAVKPGALVSSQYPYQYVKDVIQAVKRQAFAHLSNQLDDWFVAAKDAFLIQHQENFDTVKALQAEQAVLEAWIEVRQAQADTVRDWLSQEA